jgi:hypothetical protein
MFGSTQPYIGVDEVEKANETEHLPALLLRLHDKNSRQYATLTHDELSKNHPGEFDDTESFEKYGRMYRATDNPSDGYNALEPYISKLNPHCSAFFQFPKRKGSAIDSVWYENRPLGVNKLGVMMREISEEAKLSSIYTNLCVRATAITLWSDAGLENRHIMAGPFPVGGVYSKIWATGGGGEVDVIFSKTKVPEIFRKLFSRRNPSFLINFAIPAC